MNSKYLYNTQNILFLKDWLTRLRKENRLKNFCDDYHIDEIDSTITKQLWVESGLKIYEDYNHCLKTFFPQIEVMLCIDLGEKRLKGKYPSLLNNDIVANSDTPPSIYLFNKSNINIIDTLQECTVLNGITEKKDINIFYKEEYNNMDNSFYRTLFFTDSSLK